MLSEKQVETMCEDLLRQVDRATAPERMSLEDALGSCRSVLGHLRDELGARIAAAEEDLGG